ncbi:restriction endonuclease [Arcobacter arenosus]|uniref:nSTAND3 domain-containing NTPase n=1 Tax=Arcobacter arenosus TaxID=2576037 RepID=UPI003BAC5DEA
MSQNYDFKNLSPIDFEELCRDLLQEELGITFESFTEGKDGGIDFRYTKGVNNVVLQCKRFTKETFSSLETELKKELPKVKKLHPTRYILITSFGLTPSNENRILNIFRPYILSTSDIFGKNDINNLLGKFERIEKKHYKLWMSSSSILSKLLHSDLHHRTESKLEEIRDKLNIYVMNESYNNAIDILNENNYCVISGVPGIGKTTLANILSFELIQKDYEFCFVSNNIAEAWKLFKKDEKQVFYFDDFLGSNFLDDRLEKNEDADLISFIQKIKKLDNKKLILTTREYILNQAKQIYSKLDNQDLELAKCTLDLGNYTKQIKAKILYNHLFYSDINLEYIDSLVKSKIYHKIISHPNYSPRLIEYTTAKNIEALINKEDYPSYIMTKLNNPESIWKDAFQKLSIKSQCLLYVLSISNIEILKQELNVSFNSLYKYMANEYHFSIHPFDYNFAIKELDGNFIISNLDDAKQSIISFHNPSIRDFLINLINSNYEIKKFLIESLKYFNQVFYLFETKSETNKYGKRIVLDKELENMLSLKAIALTNNIKNTSVKITYASDNQQIMKPNIIDIVQQMWMLHNKFLSNEDVENFIKNTIVNRDIKSLFLSSEQNRPSLIALLNIYNFENKEQIIFKLLDSLLENYINYDEDIECIIYSKKYITGFDEYFENKEELFVEQIENYADEVAYSIDKFYDGSDTINLIDEFTEVIDTDIDYAFLKEKSGEAISYHEYNSEEQMERWREERIDIESDDSYIDSIFSTLSEK